MRLLFRETALSPIQTKKVSKGEGETWWDHVIVLLGSKRQGITSRNSALELVATLQCKFFVFIPPTHFEIVLPTNPFFKSNLTYFFVAVFLFVTLKKIMTVGASSSSCGRNKDMLQWNYGIFGCWRRHARQKTSRFRQRPLGSCTTEQKVWSGVHTRAGSTYWNSTLGSRTGVSRWNAK